MPQDVIIHPDGSLTRAKDGVAVTRGRSEKMSKSKKNVVDLTVILRDYGVDAARLFVISDTPPDRDLDWTDTGIQGCVKFLNRLWRLVTGLSKESTLTTEQKAKLLKRSHQFVKEVTQDIETFALNKYSARMREFLNELESYKNLAYGSQNEIYALEALIIVLNPVAPHLAEELWSMLGKKSCLAQSSWPVFDPSLVIEDSVTYAIQINGKLRATMTFPVGMDDEFLKQSVLQEAALEPHLNGKSIRKWIIIPGKVVNLVAV